MESLSAELEMASESKPHFKEFLGDVNDKVTTMTTFKKVCIKFTIGLEQYLKKDSRDLHAKSPHRTHIYIHVYECVHICI